MRKENNGGERGIRGLKTFLGSVNLIFPNTYVVCRTFESNHRFFFT